MFFAAKFSGILPGCRIIFGIIEEECECFVVYSYRSYCLLWHIIDRMFTFLLSWMQDNILDWTKTACIIDSLQKPDSGSKPRMFVSQLWTVDRPQTGCYITHCQSQTVGRTQTAIRDGKVQFADSGSYLDWLYHSALDWLCLLLHLSHRDHGSNPRR